MAKCGVCDYKGGDYLNHVCKTTGFKPTDIRHQDALTNGRFSKQAIKAQERGAKKVEILKPVKKK